MWSYGQATIDVTGSATWVVADSNLSDELTPSSVAMVAAPGRIVPLRQGNISIHVRSPTVQVAHVVAPHTYAVDPAAPAIALAPDLSGFVFEVDGFTLIPDVRVEIVDGGIDTGKYDQTRVNGAYFLEHLRMGVPLTVRASKPGYVASTQTHPGIVDDSSGYPEPNFLHFRLARVLGS
jgi:hypothetical protein